MIKSMCPKSLVYRPPSQIAHETCNNKHLGQNLALIPCNDKHLDHNLTLDLGTARFASIFLHKLVELASKGLSMCERKRSKRVQRKRSNEMTLSRLESIAAKAKQTRQANHPMPRKASWADWMPIGESASAAFSESSAGSREQEI